MFSAATKSAHPAGGATYVEDVFSTYLYTGTGAAQTITNNIDLSGKGGLVWVKKRNGVESHYLYDTIQGVNKGLSSNNANAAADYGVVSSFNSNGYTDNYLWSPSETVASWTFRKQPKFFDVVTWSGNDTAGRTISHSLGSVPGMIIVKATSRTAGWIVYHRSTGATQFLNLNTTAAAGTTNIYWNDTAPTSTVFTLGNSAGVNGSGETYIAYVFAHDAGGFGTTGTDNVISCGSFVTGSTGVETITLGYEPQYVMFKRADSTGDWVILDIMRGFPNGGVDAYLYANSSAAETTAGYGHPTATGFVIDAGFGSGQTYIYMAIRRPMKVPTDATTVFKPTNQYDNLIITNFVVDAFIENNKAGTYNNSNVGARLTNDSSLTTSNNQPENAATFSSTVFQSNISYSPNYLGVGTNSVEYAFARRPGFFDVVCYTGTGTTTTQAHNLGVIPELIIVKRRNSARRVATDWTVYVSSLGNSSNLFLNTTQTVFNSITYWNSTTPTSTVFSLGTDAIVNDTGGIFIAYLFATCPGVSKVGSYTGNGSTQAISCGFTGGARFVLIKRTDATGDWYVYDTARGMTTLTDPYLLLNSTAGETATLGSVTSTAGGFTLNASVLAAINTSGASYIFLAIA